MLSQTEAEEFLKCVFPENITLNYIKNVAKFYDKDVIVHYKNEILGLNDILEHSNIVMSNTSHLSFQINSLYIINDLLTFWLKQTWFSKEDNQLHEAKSVLIFRIKNKLICEIWNLSDWNIGSINEMNSSFPKETQVFEVHKKVKDDFMQRLAVSEKYSPENFDLNNVERDCLYYYFHGYSAKETAMQMKISFRTVQAYIGLIKQRFACTTKTQLRKRLFAKVITTT